MLSIACFDVDVDVDADEEDEDEGDDKESIVPRWHPKNKIVSNDMGRMDILVMFYLSNDAIAQMCPDN